MQVDLQGKRSMESPTVLAPLEKTVEAKPHRPIYRMHRYFARRPYSVFAELVRHYSRQNEVILDPFCGGGVTLVEGILQNRRVIGFDINPIATFVTKMELLDVDLNSLEETFAKVIDAFQTMNSRLFATRCRSCGEKAEVHWFEYSAIAQCEYCKVRSPIESAQKVGVGRWRCPNCSKVVKFSPKAGTEFEIVNVLYTCPKCGHRKIEKGSEYDNRFTVSIDKRLLREERRGLWIPDVKIPDCNMQRESALFKKGIFKFRQFFTSRQLLALGQLLEIISEHRFQSHREWLLFAFSSTLRYTNRMVTRNPAWREDRPFEWSKPGFWLPPVFLEANVLQEFSRRCESVVKGKRDYLSKPPTRPVCVNTARAVINQKFPVFHVSTQSSTSIPLLRNSIDAIITDPPYGSYVHYADLCNFWSVWLREINGLGGIIDDTEEAVIARKNFPKAKTQRDYRLLLEHCFVECHRVLKPERYMVLTFHNREPRAWAALLIAALRAGFELPTNGVLFQEGIASYRHTAQSRRAGSVLGDFIFSFRKPSSISGYRPSPNENIRQVTEQDFVKVIELILQEYGPLPPDALLKTLYERFLPTLLRQVQTVIGNGDAAVTSFLERLDSIDLFNSEKRHLLQQHFSYENGKWSLK